MAKENFWDYLQRYNTPKKIHKIKTRGANIAFHACQRFLFKNGLTPRIGVSKIETAEAILRYKDLIPVVHDKNTANRILIDFYHEINPKSHTSVPAIKKTVKTRYNANKTFYDSDAWRALRYQVIKTYGRKCMVCGAVPHPENRVVIHVDHIKPRSKYPELELEFSNLQVLCEDCNLGKSNKDCIDYRQHCIEGE